MEGPPGIGGRGGKRQPFAGFRVSGSGVGGFVGFKSLAYFSVKS